MKKKMKNSLMTESKTAYKIVAAMLKSLIFKAYGKSTAHGSKFENIIYPHMYI